MGVHDQPSTQLPAQDGLGSQPNVRKGDDGVPPLSPDPNLKEEMRALYDEFDERYDEAIQIHRSVDFLFVVLFERSNRRSRRYLCEAGESDEARARREMEEPMSTRPFRAAVERIAGRRVESLTTATASDLSYAVAIFRLGGSLP